MPGEVKIVRKGYIWGWAAHPVHKNYPPTIHAIIQGRVVMTAIAEIIKGEERPNFTIILPQSDDLSTLRIMIGETDEDLELPRSSQITISPGTALTVEDMIATRIDRSWIDGGCWLDAELAGANPITIIDLLCRDFLGRTAEENTIGEGLQMFLAEGSFDNFRRMLVASDEYRKRRIFADHAPGAIFGDAVIRAVVASDLKSSKGFKMINLDSKRLDGLDDESFVAECCRQLLGENAIPAVSSVYTSQLVTGTSRLDVIKMIAALIK